MIIEPRSQTKPETQPDTPLISVVVPVHNEAPNLLPLITGISTALDGIDHEIVYVDDGSSDATPGILADTARNLPNFVHIRHRQSCGQSAAVITGVRAARGIYIATLDGDGQNDPGDIPAMLEAAMAAEFVGPKPVLIAGHRTTRKDSEAKRWGSRIANSVRGRLLKDGTPDTGCGLKLFRREAFLQIPHFDHLHRFLPALFIRSGGHVISVPVRHHPRTHGASHYGTWDRLKVGIVDLFGVAWLQRRWNQPQIDPNP
jgi:dolichol-phosphate mannosyltransferase